MMKTRDPLVQKVIDRIVKRSDAGIKKFGNTMDVSTKPTISWINDIQEELSDGIIYLEKLKTILKEEETALDKNISYGGTC